MLRKLDWVLAAIVGLWPIAGGTLGVGNIRLHSGLNQPLRAEITLHGVAEKARGAVDVRLASPEDFRRAGLDRSEVLSQLRFDVDSRGDGVAVVHVRSRKPIKEPFLNFLVEVNWPSGRLLREYTLLLDPPRPPGREPPAIETPVLVSAQVLDNPPAPAVSASPVASAPGARSYGPVRANDTLWSIAQQLRPDRSVSVHQVVMALFKANPEAFFDDNVNSLNAGAILNLPDNAVIESMTPGEAEAEFRRQYQVWQEYRQKVAEAAGPQPAVDAPAAVAEQMVAKVAPTESTAPQEGAAMSQDAAVQSAGSATPLLEKPELKLVALSEDKVVSEAAGAPGDADASPVTAAPPIGGQDIRKELDLALEQAHTSQRESDELRQRLAELETQVGNLRGMLQVKDNEMALLKERLTAQQAAKHVAPGAPSPAQEASLLDALASERVLLGSLALGVATLGALGWLVVRRRAAARASEGELPVGLGASALAPVGEEAPVAAFPSESFSGTGSPAAGRGDPLAEAGVYLAYGRYDQAKSMLDQAMAQEPQRPDLMLKMLEIHFATKDRAGFVAQAQDLFATLDGNHQDPLWQKAASMGREIEPLDPLFSSMGVHAVKQPMPDADARTDDLASGHDQHQAEEETTEFDLAFLGDVDRDGSLDDVAEVAAPASTTVQTQATIPGPSGEETLDEVFSGLELEIPEAEESTVQAAAVVEEEADSALSHSEVAEILEAVPEASVQDVEPSLEVGDEMGIKLDLARAYVDMGDPEGARDVLQEVMQEGSREQKREAESLLAKIA